MITLIIGIVIGVITTGLGMLRLRIGYLRIDRSDPTEQPYLFLELKRNVPDFSTKKYVLLEVKNENFLPQE